MEHDKRDTHLVPLRGVDRDTRFALPQHIEIIAHLSWHPSPGMLDATQEYPTSEHLGTLQLGPWPMMDIMT